MKRSADVPFRPASFPFFYGWVILAVATIGAVLSVPGQTIGIGVFTEPLMTVLGLSRLELSEAYMAGTIASSFFLPAAGRAYDRRGARVIILAASLGLGATLAYLAQCDRVASRASEWLGRRELFGRSLPFLSVSLGFFSVRFWGQGVLTMSSRALLGKWFRRRRGFAAALSGVAVAGAFSIAPAVFSVWIEAIGWRRTWTVLAIGIGLGMSLIGGLLVRDNPEECGLRVDGDDVDGKPTGEARIASALPNAPSRNVERDFTLAEAMATYPFWLFNAALSLLGLVITAFTFHILSIAEDAGIDRDRAVTIFPIMAIFSVTSTFCGGWAADRIRLKWLVALLLAALAAGCTGALHFEKAGPRFLAAIGFGISGGLFSDLTPVVWPRYFGRAHLGAISGVNMAAMVLGSGVGPYLFAQSRSRTGHYSAAFLICSGVALVGFLGAFRLRNPQAEERDRSREDELE